MTLTKSLTRPLTRPLVSGLEGYSSSQDLPEGVTLLNYYPLRNNLIDNVTGSSASFSRASTSTIIDWRGSSINFAVNEPAFSGLDIGLNYGSSNDSLQVSTTGWPVNDVSFYLRVRNFTALNLSGSNVFFDSVDNGPNDILFNYSTSLGQLFFRKRLSTVNYVAAIPVTINDGDTVEVIGELSSVDGVTLKYLHMIGNDPNTDDAVISPTAALGSRIPLTSPTKGYHGNFKVFSGTGLTFEQARNAV